MVDYAYVAYADEVYEFNELPSVNEFSFETFFNEDETENGFIIGDITNFPLTRWSEYLYSIRYAFQFDFSLYPYAKQIDGNTLEYYLFLSIDLPAIDGYTDYSTSAIFLAGKFTLGLFSRQDIEYYNPIESLTQFGYQYLYITNSDAGSTTGYNHTYIAKFIPFNDIPLELSKPFDNYYVGSALSEGSLFFLYGIGESLGDLTNVINSLVGWQVGSLSFFNIVFGGGFIIFVGWVIIKFFAS